MRREERLDGVRRDLELLAQRLVGPVPQVDLADARAVAEDAAVAERGRAVVEQVEARDGHARAEGAAPRGRVRVDVEPLVLEVRAEPPPHGAAELVDRRRRAEPPEPHDGALEREDLEVPGAVAALLRRLRRPGAAPGLRGQDRHELHHGTEIGREEVRVDLAVEPPLQRGDVAAAQGRVVVHDIWRFAREATRPQ